MYVCLARMVFQELAWTPGNPLVHIVLDGEKVPVQVLGTSGEVRTTDLVAVVPF